MDVPHPSGLHEADAPLILLVDARTEVERGLIKDWMTQADVHPAAVLPNRGSAIARPLVGVDDEATVAAARVAWLPRERDGQRRVRWSDLVSLSDPATPTRPASGPDRATGTRPRGRGASPSRPPSGQLRSRFGRHTDRASAQLALGDFVARQADAGAGAGRAGAGRRTATRCPSSIVEAIDGEPSSSAGTSRELAARLEQPEAEVAAKAEADLHGLVASMSPMAVDLLTGVLRPLHARAWDVQADSAGLEKLRGLNRHHPLVFLPSHRSYADPLLLADVLAEHDFPRNHVLGGENLRFWPIGPLAKRAGIVFIRRSFGDDEIYKLAVREYFGFLLSKRFNLEWYMEGGRSRTGKLRPPRYGLLANVAEAVERGPHRRRLPRPGVDHLRPAARGLGDGRRAGRRPQEGRGAGLARAGTRRRSSARSGRRTCGSPSRSRCAPRWRPRPTRTTRTHVGWPCRRWPSRSPWGSTASPRSSPRRWSR